MADRDEVLRDLTLMLIYLTSWMAKDSKPAARGRDMTSTCLTNSPTRVLSAPRPLLSSTACPIWSDRVSASCGNGGVHMRLSYRQTSVRAGGART
jgi:hypothetical protein